MLRLGSVSINRTYLGSTEINRVYLGSTIVDGSVSAPGPSLRFSLASNSMYVALFTEEFGGGPVPPSLRFSLASNSMYTPLLIEEL